MKYAPCLIVAMLLASALPAQNQAIQTTTGTSGYALIPNNPTLVPAQITCEAWVFFVPMNLAPAGVYPTILRKNVAPGQEVYFLRVEQGSGNVRFKVRLAGGLSAAAVSTSPLPTNVWTHVAGTYDGTTARLYLNGVQVATGTGTGVVTDTGGDLRIGKGDDTVSGGETWNGMIDEVRIWSVARSAAQIASTKNWSVDNVPNLLTSWHFDGTFLDLTGGQHGSGVGTVTFVPSGAVLNSGPPPYQVNVPQSSFDVDGVQGDLYSLASVTRTFNACTPATATVNFNSSNAPLPWDLAITGGPAVPANAGGFYTAGGQRVNVNIADPSLIFLNGLTLTTPFAPFSIPLSIGGAFDVTAQMLVLDPGSTDGIALSQATELHTVAGPTTIAGPTGDDTGVTVLLSNPVFCLPPAAIPFFGNSYTKFDVISNGRVMFGSPTVNTSYVPAVATAQTDYPFMGAWCDMNPAAGGSISVTASSPGVMSVTYTNVPYYGTTIANTFTFVFDGNTGVVSIDGLSGIHTYTNSQFLGVSPGNLGPATNPGATVFSLGGPFNPPVATDMIYAFGTEGSLTPGLTRIDFVPVGTGYVWYGF